MQVLCPVYCWLLDVWRVKPRLHSKYAFVKKLLMFPAFAKLCSICHKSSGLSAPHKCQNIECIKLLTASLTKSNIRRVEVPPQKKLLSMFTLLEVKYQSPEGQLYKEYSFSKKWKFQNLYLLSSSSM